MQDPDLTRNGKEQVWQKGEQRKREGEKLPLNTDFKSKP